MTKLEANANRYSFVWAKNTQRYQEQLQVKVKALITQIEQANSAENFEYGEQDLGEMGAGVTWDSQKLAQKIQELNERLRSSSQKTEEPLGEPVQPEAVVPSIEKDTQPPKKRRRHGKSAQSKAQQALKKLEEDCLPRQTKYEEQERKLGRRKSYSKTDEDATFMRMKEDHMRNGQLKPGYNIQMGTEDQFVVGFSLHQRPADPGCLVPHLKGVKEQLGRLPQNIIADSAYGSEENYAYLEQEAVGNFLKYNTFGQQQRSRYKPNPFAADQFPYELQKDELICPA